MLLNAHSSLVPFMSFVLQQPSLRICFYIGGGIFENNVKSYYKYYFILNILLPNHSLLFYILFLNINDREELKILLYSYF